VKNSIIIGVLFVLLGSSFSGKAQTVQYVTLVSTNLTAVQYPLQTNQVVSLVGYDTGTQPSVGGYLPDGTAINLNPYHSQSGTAFVFAPSIPHMFTGLTSIKVAAVGYSSNVSWATFQITTPASANVVSNYVPADAIVIPASATGNVQIILESSTDLLNWTAANPGTYAASSATNRFFRVRGVHN
jgi:hypothetical protein